MASRALALLVLWPCAVSAADPPAGFQPADAAPYFADGPAAAAAAKLRLQEWSAAASGFSAYLRAHPRASDGKQAAFLAAYAALKAGDFAQAATRFDALQHSYPLLADYHRVWAARALLQLGKAKDALSHLQPVAADSALDGDARYLRGEAARALGKSKEAAEAYRGYLEAYPSSWRAAEVRYRLGEMLAAEGRAADATAEFRRVYLEAPTESWGKDAEAHLGQDARQFAAPDLVSRAAALFDGMRNAESEAEWNRVLGAPGLTDALACTARYHVAQSVFKQRDRKRAAPLFDAAAEACAKANDDDLLTKALYQGGRSWSAFGDKDLPALQKATTLFQRVWREHPKHSFADDARVREAETLETLKDDLKVGEALAAVPEAFPTGDQKGEAMWRLAFRAWKKGDLAEAERWLRRELDELPREDGWWEAGRTLYWLGRIAERKGDPAAAHTYERAVREYPLSYYALQALNRMRERDPAATTKLLEELLTDGGDAEGWHFRPRAAFQTAAFRRGLELARLGLGAEAKRELALAGIQVPQKRGLKPKDDDEAEAFWLAAVLYDRAGEHALSHFIPRHILTDWAHSLPTGANRKRWLLAYPRGYADLIERHAGDNGVPPALEFAIVREESAFDPLLESFANAIGLTQLTAAPAARFANGLPHDRAALRDPAINVTIGAREIGQLLAAYGGNPALAIAGYNAGEGAVGRWMRDPQRANLTLDEFIEAIPYDETRGYTKRVLSSYFTYLWLWSTGKPDERVPSLPLPMVRQKAAPTKP
jgi:soluble lytic murein transglycosylase